MSQTEDFQSLVRAITVRLLGIGWIDPWGTETLSAIVCAVFPVLRTIGTHAFEVIWHRPSDLEEFADLAAACRFEHGDDALAHRSVAAEHVQWTGGWGEDGV